MTKFLHKINRHENYINNVNEDHQFNITLCKDECHLHYDRHVETRIIAKFNVTDTSSPTQLCYNSSINQFSAIEIYGVKQSSVVSSYTFSSIGEHTVKFTLTDLTTIGNYAFNSCRCLTSITIPDSVTSIDSSAFEGCSSLTSITIGNSVTSISSSAFRDCSSLTSITIPDSVISIDYYAFSNCSSLTSVTIPSSVTSIGFSAFSNCSSLTSVNISDLTAWCSNIQFDDYYSNPLYYAHHLYINGNEIKNLVIPNNVTFINAQTFSGCNGLTSVTIPNSVTDIDYGAFYNCIGLTSIIIPSSVTSIKSSAFSNCTGLTSIISNATTAPTIQSNTFKNVKIGGTLTIPSNSTGYDVWIGTGDYYLGKYNWTKVEQ